MEPLSGPAGHVHPVPKGTDELTFCGGCVYLMKGVKEEMYFT